MTEKEIEENLRKRYFTEEKNGFLETQKIIILNNIKIKEKLKNEYSYNLNK